MMGFICHPEYPDPDDPDYYLTDELDDEDFEKWFDCGFVSGEGCLLGGSEECDFECPYRDELLAHPDFPNVKLDGW